MGKGDPRLDQASVKAVTGQKMKPAMIGNQATAACVKLPIVWELKE
jgi:hypothetical protein